MLGDLSPSTQDEARRDSLTTRGLDVAARASRFFNGTVVERWGGQRSSVAGSACTGDYVWMVAFLYSLSDLSVAILFSSVVGLIFIATPLLRARLFGDVSEVQSEVARTTITAVIGFTGVVLAFSLVQAQGNLRTVEKSVASEAMQLEAMDRLLVSYGEAGAIRQAVRAYAASVVADEWPQLSQHGRSPRTEELFGALTRQVLAMQPTPGRGSVIYGDLVKTVDQLTESRQDRLGATDLGLPPIFWEVIGLLMALLVACAAFVERRRAVSLGGLGAGLALLATLVFIFDQPFLGDVSATPEPFVRALQAMQG
jgi:Protein of unknown function (DUF4239)